MCDLFGVEIGQMPALVGNDSVIGTTSLFGGEIPVAGAIVDQQAVEVDVDDDEASLHERIKVVERALLVDVVRRLATHNVHVSGRKVTLA